MAEFRMKIAHLNEAQIAKLRTLEAELGTCIVALEREYQLADLYIHGDFICLESSVGLKAVHLWHHDVQKDEIRLCPSSNGELRANW